MKAKEFKSKTGKNADKKAVQGMISLEEEVDSENFESIDSSVSFTELESINKGLKDFEEGKIHSHEAARKLYEKYL